VSEYRGPGQQMGVRRGGRKGEASRKERHFGEGKGQEAEQSNKGEGETLNFILRSRSGEAKGATKRMVIRIAQIKNSSSRGDGAMGFKDP